MTRRPWSLFFMSGFSDYSSYPCKYCCEKIPFCTVGGGEWRSSRHSEVDRVPRISILGVNIQWQAGQRAIMGNFRNVCPREIYSSGWELSFKLLRYYSPISYHRVVPLNWNIRVTPDPVSLNLCNCGVFLAWRTGGFLSEYGRFEYWYCLDWLFRKVLVRRGP